jgi:hypothetical protein
MTTSLNYIHLYVFQFDPQNSKTVL